MGLSMMCSGETCSLASHCVMSPKSGTKPSDNQGWFIDEPYWRDGTASPTLCDWYWPKKETGNTSLPDTDVDRGVAVDPLYERATVQEGSKEDWAEG